MSNNPFIRDPKKYIRDLDIISNYCENMAQYLAISTGDKYEDVLLWVKSNIKPVEPKLKVLARRDGADRKKEVQELSKYLNEVSHTNRLLGPNLIVYDNPKKNKSFISEFIDKGLERRSIVKKKGQKAEMEGDMETAIFCDNQQGRIKILNNSISGAHASPHNPIYNATAHTTLTSVCRCATSYSNAVVEKLLTGNRHYYSPEIALADLASIIRITDLDKLEKAMAKYSIVPPTKEYALAHILESCNLYWRSPTGNRQLSEFINAMSDIELSAITYVSDLKGIRDTNDAFMRRFIGCLVEKATVGIDEPEKYHKAAGGDLLAMVGLVMSEELKGRTVDRMAKEDPEYYRLYGATIKQILDSLSLYTDFIDAFLRTDNMPPAIHTITSSLRRVAIVSDTDSTIFTTENWVRWYLGKNEFNVKAMSVAGAIAYIDSQVLAHTLAMLSRHLGVGDDQLFRLAMKSEFYQPVLGVTNMSKHYFSYIQACEGNVYSELKFDTKGVNLKNSRLPGVIKTELNNYIRWIMDSVMSETKPTLRDVLRIPATIAHDISASLSSGDTSYLSHMQIKPKSSYKGDNPPAWVQYQLWTKVFAPVYGPADPPPYSAVKVPVIIDSRAKMDSWAETLDPAMSKRLREMVMGEYTYTSVDGLVELRDGDVVLFITRKGGICGDMGKLYTYRGQAKSIDLSSLGLSEVSSSTRIWEYTGSTRESFTSFMVPVSRLRDGKMPVEIARIVDSAKIEDEMLAGFMIALETTGFYIRNSGKTRLLSKEIDIDIYKENKNE
jgi:hypothetical protein